MFKYLSLIVLFIIVFACGETKEIVRLNEKESARYTEMFHEGVRYKIKKQYQNAIHVFEACTQLNQFDDAPYFALSELYSSIGKKEESIVALKKASDLKPSNEWYKEALTFKFQEAGKLKESIEGYKQLLKKNPQNVEWLINLSECYFKNKQLKESYTILSQLEEIIGKNPEIIIEKYRILYFLKKYEQGEKELINGLKLFPDDPNLLAILVDFYFEQKEDQKALNMLYHLSDIDPSNGNVHLTLAQHYLQVQDLPNTFKELKLAFVCPEIPLENKTRFTMYFFDTQAKLDKNVIELGQILVSQYPNDAKVHTLLGDLYMKNDDELMALASFKNAISLDPSKYSIWEQVLVMEYEFQQFENLYTDGVKALELFPSYSKLYLLTGTAANQVKKYAEATEILNNGKDLIVNNPEIKAEFYAQLGQASFKLKNNVEARKYYDEALVLSPSNRLNLNNYAYYLALEKIDLNKAEIYINEVLQTNPNDYHFIDTYGFVKFQQGDYKTAKENFEKAHFQNSKDPLINDHLGDACFKLGLRDEALKFWKMALELGSKNFNLPKKIEKMHYYDPVY
jgi:tetratricopeptide (TPR) repeat protein